MHVTGSIHSSGDTGLVTTFGSDDGQGCFGGTGRWDGERFARGKKEGRRDGPDA